MSASDLLPKRLDELGIVKYPAAVLRKPCVPVVTFDAQLSDFVARMTELMLEAPGVGLAAPQVGVSLRLFVFNPTGQPGDHGCCINPVITDARKPEESIEGCLSIPGVEVSIRRATTITLRAFAPDGSAFELGAFGLLARIWQHEADHLDGRLIIDNLSEADKIQTRRQLKQLRDDYQARR